MFTHRLVLVRMTSVPRHGLAMRHISTAEDEMLGWVVDARVGGLPGVKYLIPCLSAFPNSCATLLHWKVSYVANLALMVKTFATMLLATAKWYE